MVSSGLHANGYSLVRAILDRARWGLDRDVPELGRTVGEELLEPTRIYAAACSALTRSEEVEVHAFAHVTGGGIGANLARVLPSDVTVRLDRSTWSPQPVFGLLGALGGVEQSELERALNMGVGMLAVVARDDADTAVDVLKQHRVTAWVAGETIGGDGTAELVGAYRP